MAYEKELKYALTAREYHILSKHFRDKIHQTLTQENYYFDDNSLGLRKKKIGLRIRISNKKKAYITLKEKTKNPTNAPKSFRVRKEWETTIPLKSAHTIIRRKKSIFSPKNEVVRRLSRLVPKNEQDTIQLLGKMTNIRKLINIKRGLTIELDRFYCFGKRFYELEVESPRPMVVDTWITEMFHSLKVRKRPSQTSKLARFLAGWKRQ